MTKIKYEQLKNFFAAFPVTTYPKGYLLYKPGDKINHIHFLKSGYIQAYTTNGHGKNTINIFKPLFLASIIHYFSHSKIVYHFESLTPIEVYSIPQKEFKKYLDHHPEMFTVVMDFFCSSLMRFFHNQGSIIRGDALKKIATILLQLTDNYGIRKNGQLIVNFPITHHVISNLVGLTRETTSVQIAKLQKMGIISAKRSSFIVQDLKKLKNIAHSVK